MDQIDCIVAGAGVIGLATARQLATLGFEVLLIEANDTIGSGTSSRNSEVIHAGIYYPQGSAKARFCVAGRKALYRYLADRGLPHRRCGKLIVATDDAQTATLHRIARSAAENRVDDLRMLDRDEVLSIEPDVQATAALLSPSTGILDSHAYMMSLQADAEAHGAAIAFETSITGGRVDGDKVILSTLDRASGTGFELATTLFVNAAGLGAQGIAGRIAGFPQASIPPLRMAKGNYFSVPGHSPFSHLIYPVPVEGGLGVHLTFDLAGQMRFGPDVEWIDRLDYAVDPRRAAVFYDEIRRYWPALQDGTLAPAYCGIRPKTSGPGEAVSDFQIDGEAAHGLRSVINLFGLESPGLTASLAIAAHVGELARHTRSPGH